MANASQLKSLISLGPSQQDFFWANVVCFVLPDENLPFLLLNSYTVICL